MSKEHFQLDANRSLVYGEDRTFNTCFAQLYDTRDPDDGVPHRACGYHPAEQMDDLHSGEPYGPYPLTVEQLDEELQKWGVGPNVRRRVRYDLTDQSPTGV